MFAVRPPFAVPTLTVGEPTAVVFVAYFSACVASSFVTLVSSVFGLLELELI